MIVALFTFGIKKNCQHNNSSLEKIHYFLKKCHLHFSNSIQKTITINHASKQIDFLYLFLDVLYFHIHAIQFQSTI